MSGVERGVTKGERKFFTSRAIPDRRLSEDKRHAYIINLDFSINQRQHALQLTNWYPNFLRLYPIPQNRLIHKFIYIYPTLSAISSTLTAFSIPHLIPSPNQSIRKMASPPIPTPLKIVRLDGIHFQAPTFSIPHSYTEYQTTPNNQSVIISRISDADVVITTRVPISAETLAHCPHLKMIAVMAIGFDMIDLAACKERGVLVSNVPAASKDPLLFFIPPQNSFLNHVVGTSPQHTTPFQRHTISKSYFLRLHRYRIRRRTRHSALLLHPPQHRPAAQPHGAGDRMGEKGLAD